MQEMQKSGQQGSIVTIGCDDGNLYHDTYYSEEWLASKNIVIKPYLDQIQYFYDSGRWLNLQEFS